MPSEEPLLCSHFEDFSPISFFLKTQLIYFPVSFDAANLLLLESSYGNQCTSVDHKNPFPNGNCSGFLVVTNGITCKIRSVRKRDDYTRGRNPVFLTPAPTTWGVSRQPSGTCVPGWTDACSEGSLWLHICAGKAFVNCIICFPVNSLN